MDGTDSALQHNLGLGGAVVVTVYKRADGKVAKAVSNEEVGKRNRLGYNPAVEAKGFTKSQVDQVRSKKMRSEWVSLSHIDRPEAHLSDALINSCVIGYPGH